MNETRERGGVAQETEAAAMFNRSSRHVHYLAGERQGKCYVGKKKRLEKRKKGKAGNLSY